MSKQHKKDCEAFLALLTAGLWENDKRTISLSSLNGADFSFIFQLATEQTVLGLIAAGIDKLNTENRILKIPQETVLQFIGSALQIEQRNRAMNDYLARFMIKLRSAGIVPLLVKGQGVAQCYDKPLWRASGDVDLLLDPDNITRAKELLQPMASSIEADFEYSQHLALTIDDWEIELHGTMRCGLTKKMDRVLDRIQKEMLSKQEVRVWNNQGVDILLPAHDNDIVFIFTHYIKHFFKGGIGLRQICDWCRLLWTYKDKIDYNLLETRLREMGLMTEWKAFSAFAVDYLYYPISSMPLYDGSTKWHNKAKKILGIIIETGNFGHNKSMDYYDNSSLIARKIMSFWRHTSDSIQHFMIFPLDSLRAWNRMVYVGVRFMMTGKQ